MKHLRNRSKQIKAADQQARRKEPKLLMWINVGTPLVALVIIGLVTEAPHECSKEVRAACSLGIPVGAQLVQDGSDD
jgi:hypothetical protein